MRAIYVWALPYYPSLESPLCAGFILFNLLVTCTTACKIFARCVWSLITSVCDTDWWRAIREYPCLVPFTRRGDAITNVVCPMLEGNVVVDYIGAAAVAIDSHMYIVHRRKTATGIPFSIVGGSVSPCFRLGSCPSHTLGFLSHPSTWHQWLTTHFYKGCLFSSENVTLFSRLKVFCLVECIL